MATKHLHELLNEDQEPFILIDYINERRSQLHKPSLHLSKRKPVSPAPSYSHNLRKNSCFFAKKSPLFEFPEKSPCRRSTPSRTAALLLEAALRIQKQSKDPKPSNKMGFFGSILKKMVTIKSPRKREICGEVMRVSVKDVLRWDSFGNGLKLKVGLSENGVSETGFSCSCNSSDWTRSNEEKSIDLESFSCRTDEFEEMEFVKERRTMEDVQFGEKDVFGSPFRFRVGNRSPDSGSLTPEFSSPARSPASLQTEILESGSEGKRLYGADKDEEDKEKEQFSPVSVLDPPFEDDYDGHEEEDEEEQGTFQHNLASVQRAKHQLLNKIRRFERLAELTPLELEKVLAEDDMDDGSEEDDIGTESVTSDAEDTEELVGEIVSQLDIFRCYHRVPRDMKILVLDLIEEEKQKASEDMENLAKKVCKKIESWKEVELNTVDMIVELDYRQEDAEWKFTRQEVQQSAVEIESVIFGALLQELSVDLVDLISA